MALYVKHTKLKLFLTPPSIVLTFDAWCDIQDEPLSIKSNQPLACLRGPDSITWFELLDEILCVRLTVSGLTTPF